MTQSFDQILNQKFTTSFRSGYVNIRGVTMPARFLDLLPEIQNWNVREEDVWICSFPKTGTTWTQEMVWMIKNNLDFEEGKINLGQRSPFLEVSALFDYRKLMENNKEFLPPPFLQNSLEFVKEQKSPVCLKTHLPWNLLPDEIQNGTKKPKIIYVARNPKDTCVSYYHHCKLLEGYRGDFEEFCELFLADKLNYAPYWQHLLHFYTRRNEPNILFLKYEDMKKDLLPVLKKVSTFLNCKLSDQQYVDLLDHLSFESMKNNSAVNYELVIEFNKKFQLIDHEGCFMRSGQTGGYKTLMSPEMNLRFDRWTEHHLQNCDFSF